MTDPFDRMIVSIEGENKDYVDKLKQSVDETKKAADQMTAEVQRMEASEMQMQKSINAQYQFIAKRTGETVAQVAERFKQADENRKMEMAAADQQIAAIKKQREEEKKQNESGGVGFGGMVAAFAVSQGVFRLALAATQAVHEATKEAVSSLTGYHTAVRDVAEADRVAAQTKSILVHEMERANQMALRESQGMFNPAASQERLKTGIKASEENMKLLVNRTQEYRKELERVDTFTQRMMNFGLKIITLGQGAATDPIKEGEKSWQRSAELMEAGRQALQRMRDALEDASDPELIRKLGDGIEKTTGHLQLLLDTAGMSPANAKWREQMIEYEKLLERMGASQTALRELQENIFEVNPRDAAALMRQIENMKKALEGMEKLKEEGIKIDQLDQVNKRVKAGEALDQETKALERWLNAHGKHADAAKLDEIQKEGKFSDVEMNRARELAEAKRQIEELDKAQKKHIETKMNEIKVNQALAQSADAATRAERQFDMMADIRKSLEGEKAVTQAQSNSGGGLSNIIEMAGTAIAVATGNGLLQQIRDILAQKQPVQLQVANVGDR